MDLGLRDKSFVVGGGSRGIGRAVAAELVAEGARVLLVARDEEAVSVAAEELGPRASAYAADVAEPEAAAEIATAALAEVGALDGLLVNAGGPPPGAALQLSDEQWRGAYELLIGGPIRLVRALEPEIRDGGAIVFVTSSSVRQPIPGLDTSNVLRPGVAALVKTLARQLAPRIRVNSISPGRIATDRLRSLDSARAEQLGIAYEEQVAQASAGIPLGRYGDPAELGRVAAFLLSPAASYVTGAAVQVDGGLVTAIP